MNKHNKKEKGPTNNTVNADNVANTIKAANKKNSGDLNETVISQVEKVLVKDVGNHSEQLVDICIKGMDHATQNGEFATQIVNNYFTNWNLIIDDIWAVYANYTNDAIASKDIEDLYNANLKAIESFTNIIKQASLVNSQIALDCCNEVVVPSIKQTTTSVEKLKKCYS